MRLLLVIDNLGPGGAQRQLVNLARELACRGHQVEVFVYSAGDHFRPLVEAAGIPIHLHPKPSRWSWAPVRALRSLMRDGGFDLVLSFMSIPNLYTVLAAAMMPRRPKIVVSERSMQSGGLLGIRQRLIEPLYRQADHVTVNSHHFRAYYHRQYPWMRERLSTIWNGIDLAGINATPVRRAGGPLRLLCVGNMMRSKNWLCVVKALALLREKHALVPQVSWVGRLSSLNAADTRYFQLVRQAIEDLRLTDQWTWLGQRRDVSELLSTHHALIHPSYLEGLPNVVCEALAAARPVLVSDTLDHPLLVQNGSSGYVFDWRSPHRLAEAIVKLSQSSDTELTAMGQAGRAFAEAHLSLTRCCDEYEDLFKSLVTALRQQRQAADWGGGVSVEPRNHQALTTP
jgi:glycosyltransferase involved in cell wall biosynthesis